MLKSGKSITVDYNEYIMCTGGFVWSTESLAAGEVYSK